jgi:hypothetical protein
VWYTVVTGLIGSLAVYAENIRSMILFVSFAKSVDSAYYIAFQLTIIDLKCSVDRQNINYQNSHQ